MTSYIPTLITSIAIHLLACASGYAQAPAETAPLWPYQVVERSPHSAQTFTQGLEIHNGWFYESSGHYGRSFISRYQVKDNSQRHTVELPNDRFAEGLTRVGDAIYLLSWRAGIAWEMAAETLAVRKIHRYSGEGWGLAYDGEYLIMSDGSHRLRYYTPGDFRLVKSQPVTLDGEPLNKLNELEFADNLLWANRWHSDSIFAIDIASGEVVGQLDASPLREDAGVTGNREAVLNGIAYDPARNGYWVTGKYWPYRYLLQITDNRD